MAGIGQIGGGGTSTAQYLSSLKPSPALSLDQVTGECNDASSTADGSDSSTNSSDLKNQLLAAISDALKQADPDSKPGDLLDAIKKAVEKTLKANGIEPPAAKDSTAGADGADPKTTAQLLELLTTNSDDASAAELQSLLGQSTSGAGQDQLLDLLKQAPSGFNLNVAA